MPRKPSDPNARSPKVEVCSGAAGKAMAGVNSSLCSVVFSIAKGVAFTP